MNDFTKEELQSIINLIEVYCDGDSMTKLSYKPLYDKIQSIIHSFSICKHARIVTGAYPRSNPPMKCDDCGVLYYE